MKNYEYRDLRPPQYQVEYNLLLLMIEFAPLLAAETGDLRYYFYSAEKSATIFLYMLYALDREIYPVKCPETFTTGI